MITLLQLITTKLKEVTNAVYLENAPINATFPYVVYRMPNSTENEAREDFILEVDLWDNKPSTMALEGLADTINDTLHRLQHYEEGKLQASIYRINRLMIPDEDPTIRRRQLRFQVQAYKGGIL